MNGTEKEPANYQAILDWCEANRPDLYPVVKAEKNNDGFILLMQVGFEAGRRFQDNNPDFPLNTPGLYLDPAQRIFRGTNVTASGFVSEVDPEKAVDALARALGISLEDAKAMTSNFPFTLHPVSMSRSEAYALMLKLGGLFYLNDKEL